MSDPLPPPPPPPSKAEKAAAEAQRKTVEAKRRIAVARKFATDPDYREFCIKPHRTQADAALRMALVESRKPAAPQGVTLLPIREADGRITYPPSPYRNDARVSELLRDYGTYDELASHMDRVLDAAEKAQAAKESDLPQGQG